MFFFSFDQPNKAIGTSYKFNAMSPFFSCPSHYLLIISLFCVFCKYMIAVVTKTYVSHIFNISKPTCPSPSRMFLPSVTPYDKLEDQIFSTSYDIVSISQYISLIVFQYELSLNYLCFAFQSSKGYLQHFLMLPYFRSLILIQLFLIKKHRLNILQKKN